MALKLPGSYTGVVTEPGNTRHWYLLEQAGRVVRLDPQSNELNVFLDISPQILALYNVKPQQGKIPDERGLLSLAFHPEYNVSGSLYNGVFIVMFNMLNDPKLYDARLADNMTDINCMVVLYQFVNRNTAAETLQTAKLIMAYPKPEANHNGGGLVFGRDNYLYIGTGDGGSGGDPHGNLLTSDPNSYLGFAQDLKSPLGKILRIGVVQPLEQQLNYHIPSTNVLANNTKGYVKEMIACGIRNAFRMSFDDAGNLWIGDVGQNTTESVKIINYGSANNRLINFGWRAYEGNDVFNADVLQYIQASGQTITMPYITYPRELGVAIVGVALYNSKIESLKNKIIIADYAGRIMYANATYHGSLNTLYNFDVDKLRVHSLNVMSDGEIVFTLYNSESKQSSFRKLTFDMYNSKLTSANLAIDQARQPNQSVPAANTNSNNSLEVLIDADIQKIVEQAVRAANMTKSDFRKDSNGNSMYVAMHIAIARRGDKEAQLYHSMSDAWQGSIDIAKRKAFTAMAFSSDQNAMTTYDIGKASQPGGPLWQIGNSNPEGGIIEFAGGIPLFKNNKLVGAIGVSGDSPQNDESVAFAAARGYEAADYLRIPRNF